MNSILLMGTAQVAGLASSVAFDPNAEPSESWVVRVGESARGAGPTPEIALDGARRMLKASDVRLKQVTITAR